MELETQRFEQQVQTKIQSLESQKKELHQKIKGLDERLAQCQKTLASLEDLKSQARRIEDLDGDSSRDAEPASEEDESEESLHSSGDVEDLGIWVDSPKESLSDGSPEENAAEPEVAAEPEAQLDQDGNGSAPSSEYAIPGFLRQYM